LPSKKEDKMKAIVAVDSNWGMDIKGICFNVFPRI